MTTVLVCGGRDANKHDVWNWLEKNAIADISDALGVYLCPITKMIHGGARGADEGAADWGKSEPGVTVVAYPADWKKHGKAAGPIRNQRMIDEGKPDVVIAFPGGRGTADMIRRAEAAGIPVVMAEDLG